MSPLQTQYPLSPRKFWKKFIGKLIFWFFVWVFLLFMLGLFSWTTGMVNSISKTPDDLAPYFQLGMFILTALIAGGLILYAWYLRAYIRRYYYDANENFVTIKKGVFAPTEIHVQYQKIQDVYVDQDILDRIMGLYDVHIASATATSGIEAHIDGVEHEAAEGLKNLLLARIQHGGTAAPQGAMPAAAPAASAPVQLSEEISSKQYPIETGWILQNVITYFISSAFLSGLLSFYSKSSQESMGDVVGSFIGISSFGVWFWLFLVIFAGHIIYALIWRSTYSFAFLPEYIQMRSGIISRSEVHLPYRTVQDVVVSQGVIERMLGIATVNIQNAAAAQMVGKRLVTSGIVIPGQPLEKANHIADVVRSVILTKNSTQTGL